MSKTKIMITTALMSAVCCILGPFSIPIGPIPISLGVIGVLLCVYALGMNQGTIAVLIYIALGAVGLPVFSGFGAGISKLLGPTGGYIMGYITFALIAGWFIDRCFFKNRYIQVIGMLLGLISCYALGTLWFMVSTGTGFVESIMLCVAPFVVVDIAKIVFCFVIGNALRRILIATNAMEYVKKDLFNKN